MVFSISFLISSAVYLITACPTVYTGDSGELSATIFSLSIAHPPGYPLLTILGKAFLFFARGNVAASLNIMSALLAAAATGMLALLIHSLLFQSTYKTSVPRIIISTGGSLLFGFSNILWATAVGFEVYSLGILLIALVLYLLLKYKVNHSFLYLLTAVYLFGLALANHLSSLTLAPALIIITAISRPDFRKCSSLVLFFILALTLYLYLPIRSAHYPLFDWDHPASLSALLDHITARRYQTYITGFGFDNWFQNLWRSLRILLNQFPLYLSALGLIGLLFSRGISTVFRYILLSVLVVNLVLSALYDIPDIDQYYLPSMLVLTIGLVLFFDLLLSKFKERFKEIVFAVLVAAIAVWTLIVNYNTNDQSHNNLARVYGENILKSTPENSFLISVGDNSNSSLYYLRYVEKVRDDLEIYDPVISIERLRIKMKELNLRSDLSGPDLCVLLGRAFAETTYIVKEHMLARGNPFNYDRLNLYPNGMVYGFMDKEPSLDTWNDLVIPSYSSLARNLDFKGMTMLINTHLCYGQDLFKMRKSRDAVDQYREARKIADATREASVHNSLGIFFRHEGWPVMAKREYENALAAEHLTADEKSNIYVNLGNLEKDRGKLDSAVEYYMKSLEINDDNNEARYNQYLAMAYNDLNRRDYKSAVSNFEKASELPESDPNIIFNIAVIYDQNLNDTAKAIFYYKRFMGITPSSDQTSAARRRVGELEINTGD